MKILMLSSYLPYPLYSGGHIRLYNIIKQLSKRHEIVLVCEKRSNQTEKDIDEVKKFCSEVITVDRKKQWTIANILKAGSSSYPFLLAGHTNLLLTQAIKDKLKEGFDLIHIETFYVMQNLPDVKIPTVLVEHNIEYLVYDRYRKTAPYFLQPFMAIDIAKLKYWEQNFWTKATKLVAVSDVEKRQMGREDVVVVPNGVDTKKFEARSMKSEVRNEKRILFIGDFKWVQNRDAVDWLLKEIWLKIIQNSEFRIQNVKLWIVGKNIPNSIKQLTNDPNVIFDENAPEDTVEIFKQTDILLAPIRVGGGTSYKILEAMASGVPVVTTKLGMEGLKVSAGQDLLIGDTSLEIANAVISLLKDKDMYKEIITNAREVVEKEYNWETIVKKLEAVYESIKN